jgi:hypothetical protein
MLTGHLTWVVSFAWAAWVPAALTSCLALACLRASGKHLAGDVVVCHVPLIYAACSNRALRYLNRVLPKGVQPVTAAHDLALKHPRVRVHHQVDEVSFASPEVCGNGTTASNGLCNSAGRAKAARKGTLPLTRLQDSCRTCIMFIPRVPRVPRVPSQTATSSEQALRDSRRVVQQTAITQGQKHSLMDSSWLHVWLKGSP